MEWLNNIISFLKKDMWLLDDEKLPWWKNALIKTAKVVILTAKAFISVELNMGQMIEDVILATESKRPVTLCNRAGGMIPDPKQVLNSIIEVNGGIQ